MTKRILLATLSIAGLLPLAVMAQSAPTTAPASQPAGDARTIASGVAITVVKAPDAEQSLKGGDVAVVNYVGLLADGKEFDSSAKAGKPFAFRIGQTPPEVIKGWEEGLVGMKIGEKRHLVIPAAAAYGEKGYPPTIPANATLSFDIELVGIVRVAE